MSQTSAGETCPLVRLFQPALPYMSRPLQKVAATGLQVLALASSAVELVPVQQRGKASWMYYISSNNTFMEGSQEQASGLWGPRKSTPASVSIDVSSLFWGTEKREDTICSLSVAIVEVARRNRKKVNTVETPPPSSVLAV